MSQVEHVYLKKVYNAAGRNIHKSMPGLDKLQRCAQLKSGSRASKNDHIYLRKVFTAAGRTMHQTLPGLTLIQRCLPPPPAQDSTRNRRGAPKPSRAAGPPPPPNMGVPWYTMGPYQQFDYTQQFGYQFNPQQFQGPHTGRGGSRFGPPAYSNYPQQQPAQFYGNERQTRRQGGSRKTFPAVVAQGPQAPLCQSIDLSAFGVHAQTPSSSSSQFPSAPPFGVPPNTPPPTHLIGSVGSRDSQQYLQQQYAQNYYQNFAQQYAQVYAQQYAHQYVQLLAQQQVSAFTQQFAPQPPAVPIAPDCAPYSVPGPRVYTSTPNGPQLQKPKQPRPGRACAAPSSSSSTPLATVAAQLAQRPLGTTFHFAITGTQKK